MNVLGDKMNKSTNPLYYQKNDAWKNVSLKDWEDPDWQLKNSVTNVESLEKIIKITSKEKKEINEACKCSKFRVTPYYLSLIDQSNPECPIRLQSIPTCSELETGKGNLADPLSEDSDSPVPRLVHRYPDRVLFLVSEVCSTYCRFCTRRRMVLDKSSDQLISEHDKAIEYIRNNSQIRDVILSGGDALMLSPSVLDRVMTEIRKIPHVEILRVASRTPCVFPQRVTDEFVNVIKKHKPVFFMTHFNHPYEITEAAAKACQKIISAGIPMFNQTVLLRKINSDPSIIKKLMHELLKIGVKPYYIYQCDPADGIDHFRTSVSKGFQIMEHLRGHTSGLALPTFVIDAPGGGGKIPVMPNYLLTITDDAAVVRNYKGMMSVYINPVEKEASCSTSDEISKTIKRELEENKGYLNLLEGRRVTLKPDLSKK